MSVALGIDLGTSAIKAVLVQDQSVVAQADCALAIAHPKPGWAEQHPHSWIKAAADALAQLRRMAPQAWRCVEAIGLSGQMHGAVLLDAKQQPVRPAILWNDNRAEKQAEWLSECHPALALQAGVRPMASFVAPKLLWLRDSEPDCYRAARTILMPKDFLRLWLTGEMATDVVDASGAWLLDQRNRNFSSDIVSALRMARNWLPPLLEGSDAAGIIRPALADDLGLPRGVIVAAGTGDAAAGGLGIGMVDDGDAFLSLGTSAQIFVTTASYKPHIESMIHAFAHGLPGLWFQMAAMLNGAYPLSWWSRICGPSPKELIDEASGSLPAVSDPLFLPYLAGERTPHNDPRPAGGFYPLNAGTDRACLTRAVLEGVAFSLADAVEALALAGSEPKKLAVLGGGSRSDIWMQWISDTLQLPLERLADSAVGPAVGAARLGIMARYGVSSDVFGQPATERTFVPGARDSVLSARLEDWRKLYRSVRNAT